MSPLRGRARKACLLLALLGGACWMANRIHVYQRAQSLLPPQLRTAGMERFGSEPGQFWQTVWAALPLRSQSCGAVILRLSEATAQDIGRRRLGFFEHARTARSAQAAGGPVRYHHWQPSPLPSAWRDGIDDKGLWNGLLCMRVDRELHGRLVAARSPGAYYAVREDRHGVLVVIPRHRLVVYSWWD